MEQPGHVRAADAARPRGRPPRVREGARARAGVSGANVQSRRSLARPPRLRGRGDVAVSRARRAEDRSRSGGLRLGARVREARPGRGGAVAPRESLAGVSGRRGDRAGARGPPAPRRRLPRRGRRAGAVRGEDGEPADVERPGAVPDVSLGPRGGRAAAGEVARARPESTRRRPGAGAGEAGGAGASARDRPSIFLLSSRGAQRRGSPLHAVAIDEPPGAQRGPSLRSG